MPGSVKGTMPDLGGMTPDNVEEHLDVASDVMVFDAPESMNDHVRLITEHIPNGP